MSRPPAGNDTNNWEDVSRNAATSLLASRAGGWKHDDAGAVCANDGAAQSANTNPEKVYFKYILKTISEPLFNKYTL